MADMALFAGLNTNITHTVMLGGWSLTTADDETLRRVIGMIEATKPRFTDQSYIDHCDEQLASLRMLLSPKPVDADADMPRIGTCEECKLEGVILFEVSDRQLCGKCRLI